MRTALKDDAARDARGAGWRTKRRGSEVLHVQVTVRVTSFTIRVRFAIAAAALGLVAGSAAAVSATVGLGGGAALDGGEGPSGTRISERLTGYEETPLALSTGGNGTFRRW